MVSVPQCFSTLPNPCQSDLLGLVGPVVVLCWCLAISAWPMCLASIWPSAASACAWLVLGLVVTPELGSAWPSGTSASAWLVLGPVLVGPASPHLRCQLFVWRSVLYNVALWIV